MNGAATLLRWAVPRTPSERRRWLLTAVSSLVWAGPVILAVLVARWQFTASTDSGYYPDVPELTGYSELISNPGTWLGVSLAACLTSVAPLALAWQALRVGSTERSRRLGQLRVTGASPAQLRLLASAETTGAVLIGVLGAAVVMVVLSEATTSWKYADLRIVPPVDGWALMIVAGVVLAAVAAAGAAGAWTLRMATPAEGSDVRRLPRSRARTAWGLLVAEILGVGALFWPGTDATLYAFALIAGLTGLAFASAPYGSLGVASALERREGVVALLAAERLRADPRTPGRAAAVLLVAGAVIVGSAVYLGVMLHEILEDLDPEAGGFWGSGEVFSLVGGALAVVAAGIAVVVAGTSTLVGASEQLVTARRAFAALSAFGVTTRQLRRVLRLQTTAVALVAGQLGGLIVTVPCLIEQPAWWMWALLAGGHLLMAGLTWLSGAVVGLVLRPQVRAALDPSVLRTT